MLDEEFDVCAESSSNCVETVETLTVDKIIPKEGNYLGLDISKDSTGLCLIQDGERITGNIELTEDLINHRKIVVDVIWWNESGLKVPKQAIIDENGLNYVIKNKAGIQTKVLVRVDYETDKFAIISTYSAKELQEIGYDQKEIKNYKKINNYDEIILQKN